MTVDPLYVHGGALDAATRRFGSPGPQGWLDLSTGIAPYAFPVTGLERDAWCRLPQDSATDAFISVLRKNYPLRDKADILPIPGEQAALQWLPWCDAPAGTVVVPKIGYQGHGDAWTLAGRPPITATDPLAFAGKTGVIVLINPNNPTGQHVSPSVIRDAADRQAAHGGWLIVDEAFANTVPECSSLPLAGLPGLIVLRSFGKFFGLPGLRLGWIAGPRSVVSALKARLGPWAVSGPALAIGTAAEGNGDWIQDQGRRLETQGKKLALVLSATRLSTIGKTSLFQTMRVPDGDTAARWFDALGRAGILVRAFENQPDLLRFGLFAKDHEAERLAQALQDL